jgi:hypothetical protein
MKLRRSIPPKDEPITNRTHSSQYLGNLNFLNVSVATSLGNSVFACMNPSLSTVGWLDLVKRELALRVHLERGLILLLRTATVRDMAHATRTLDAGRMLGRNACSEAMTGNYFG